MAPDHELQWGAPPHGAGCGKPAHAFSQQHENGVPLAAHIAGACADVRLLSQSHEAHLGSAQHAVAQASLPVVWTWR